MRCYQIHILQLFSIKIIHCCCIGFAPCLCYFLPTISSSSSWEIPQRFIKFSFHSNGSVTEFFNYSKKAMEILAGHWWNMEPTQIHKLLTTCSLELYRSDPRTAELKIFLVIFIDLLIFKDFNYFCKFLRCLYSCLGIHWLDQLKRCLNCDWNFTKNVHYFYDCSL